MIFHHVDAERRDSIVARMVLFLVICDKDDSSPAIFLFCGFLSLRENRCFNGTAAKDSIWDIR